MQVGRHGWKRLAVLAGSMAACETGSSASGTDAGTPTDLGASRDAPTGGDTGVLTDTGGTPDTGPACTGTSAWVDTVGMLTTGRYAPGAAVLADGRVLVAGGYDFARGAQGSTEAYDPGMSRLASTGAVLNVPRNFPTATRLGDGSVLFTGGFNPTLGSLASCERFDPMTGMFTDASNLNVAREAHTATALPDGRVLVTGGLQAVGLHFLASAELYDPAMDAFTLVSGGLRAQRGFHAAVWVPARRSVLLVGGDSGHGELASAERWSLDTGGSVTVTPGRARAGKAVAAVLLPDGRVLAAGGANATDGPIPDADLYDPVTDGFSPTGAMGTRRMAFTLTALPDGRVLAAGGWSNSTTPAHSTDTLELYDPQTARWTPLGVHLAQARHDHVAVALPGCQVLIVGGQQVLPGADGGTLAPYAPREVERVTLPPR